MKRTELIASKFRLAGSYILSPNEYNENNAYCGGGGGISGGRKPNPLYPAWQEEHINLQVEDARLQVRWYQEKLQEAEQRLAEVCGNAVKVLGQEVAPYEQ